MHKFSVPLSLVSFVIAAILIQRQGSGSVPSLRNTPNPDPIKTPIVIPVGELPEDMAVNPLTNTIYVANFNGNTVSVIDGLTNTVTTTIRIDTSPSHIEVNPETNKIYVANNYHKTVSVIDGATNILTTTIHNIPTTLALAINPTTNMLYTLGSTEGMSIIDCNTNTLSKTITDQELDRLTEYPISIGLTVNPTTNTIYIAYTRYGGTYAHISVIDGKTNTVTAYIQGTIEMGALAVNPITNMLYAVGDNGISIINGKTNRYITTINVDNYLTDVAINEATNIVYVDSFNNETVSKINGRTNRLIAIKSQVDRPAALAINSFSNILYVANRQMNAVSVFHQDALPTITPTYTPGGPTLTPSITPTRSLGGGGP
jgi:YVTN family beta-propeller protein